ncbi:MAG: hypothetical protein WBX00_07520 [Isosphaeraceae bacterium]
MSTITAIPSDAMDRGEVTPEELLAMPDGKHYELVDRVPVERTMSLLASRVEVVVARRLDPVLPAAGAFTGVRSTR